jgi:hypothetical protein
LNPKLNPLKALRETTKGRMDHERIAEVRVPVEIPEKLSGLNASLVHSETGIGSGSNENYFTGNTC